jgi:hypothetical protein
MLPRMRVKSWIRRIPLILPELGAGGKDDFKRRDIERLFEISRSQATAVMKIAGATVRAGAEAIVSRENLKFYVERCPEAQRFIAEMERDAALREKLAGAKAYLHYRSIPISVKPVDEWATFDDLPNVSLIPGELRIVFSDQVDLLATLYRLAKAAANEFDRFSRMCEIQKAAISTAAPALVQKAPAA